MVDHESLHFGSFYHIYNRGINRERIFVEETNFDYFLKLIKKHVLAIANKYAYCLLNNHFHLLVRIKSEKELINNFEEDWLGTDIPQPSQKFSNLFNAYSKAFNKRYSRTGGLFQRPFRRIIVTTDEQLIQVVIYIHRNPEKHGIVNDFRDWKYSSFDAFYSGFNFIERNEVLDWFGGFTEFEYAHGGIE
jgi:REP element-mobilizing transposase RayT